MVSAGLDLGGRCYGVSGVWGSRAMVSMVSDALDLSCWAMVSVVSDGLDLGGRGYGVYGVSAGVVGAMVSMVSDGLDVGGPSYGVYGV